LAAPAIVTFYSLTFSGPLPFGGHSRAASLAFAFPFAFSAFGGRRGAGFGFEGGGFRGGGGGFAFLAFLAGLAGGSACGSTSRVRHHSSPAHAPSPSS
jgi:hypothetical protein